MPTPKAAPSSSLQLYNIGVMALPEDGDFAECPLCIRPRAEHVLNPFDCASTLERASKEYCSPVFLSFARYTVP